MIGDMAYLRETHPVLAEQLSDPVLGASLTAGSNKKVGWICLVDQRHRWDAVVASRATGSGCPFCAGRRVLPGDNDLATTHRELAAQLEEPSLATTLGAGSNKKVWWRCAVGHRWEAKVTSRAHAGTGCPYCSGRLVLAGYNDLTTTDPELASELVDPEDGRRHQAGSGKKVRWRCRRDPRHEWSSSILNRTNGNGCPICAGRSVAEGLNDLRTERPDLADQLADPQSDGTPAETLARTLRPASNRVVEWACHLHGRPYVWITSVNNRRAGTGCPVCSERVVAQGLNDLATTHRELAAQILDPQPDGTSREEIAATTSRGSHRLVLWECQKGHQWTTSIKDRVRGTGCPNCAGVGTSRLEAALCEAVRALLPGEEVLERQLLAGRTGRRGASPSVDVLVPGRGVGLEMNGLYWHSDAFGRPTTSHRDKVRTAREQGFQLLHVWEDEWLTRPGIVLRAIAHRLRALEHLEAAFEVVGIAEQFDPAVAARRGARTLRADQATRAETTAFLEDHHVQGTALLTRSFALRDEDGAILALLGLRSPRGNARMGRKVGDWEIQRYATRGLVPGGFTRLLAHAERVLAEEGTPLTRWISFSDDGISDGGMYEAAGFSQDAVLRPDYRYTGGIIGRRRAAKETFQKKRFREDPRLLWEEGWTEREAAEANGLHRVYDAGKTRWVKDLAT